MDINILMQKMHSAKNKSEKESIKNEIISMFSLLSDEDKNVVRKEFAECMQEKIDEGKELIERVDVYLEIKDISKYVSLNRVANDYFGKSRSWLHQRLRGYAVNGKPARFTEDERKKFAYALSDISKKMYEASIKIV